jgi:hypothetical protein
MNLYPLFYSGGFMIKSKGLKVRSPDGIIEILGVLEIIGIC